MNRLGSVWRFLFGRGRYEGELDAELRYHYERQVEEEMACGMSRAEAGRRATIVVGGAEQIKDACRDARVGRGIETLAQDLRYGARVLKKNPGFSLAAILTLALGIGANTAIFSVVYGVLLRPLPYLHGEQLVVLHQDAAKANVLDFPFSVQEIADYRERNHTFAAMAEHHTMNFLLKGNDTEMVAAGVVSANFFDVLGVKPLLGRTFVAADEAPGAPGVLLLSYKYWQTHQGGDPHIVGKTFQMNRPQKVVGVLPPIPQYPAESDVYMTTPQCPLRSSVKFISDRNARMMNVIGRLKPGVTLAEARADLAVIGANMEKSYPEIYLAADGYRIRADALRDDLAKRARTMFLVLLGVVGLVLLAACANVANLFLARLLKLERELAVRAALGAGKARLMRQLLTESVLLGLSGGVAGVLLAPAGLRVLTGFAGRFTTRAAEVRMDGPVLLFTLLASVGAGIVLGLAPALTASGWLGTAFQQAAPRGTDSRGRARLRSALVVAQVAFSVILLAGAGLMIRSFQRLESVHPGFDPDGVMAMRVSLPMEPYTGASEPPGRKNIAFYRPLLERLKAIPGVESAGLVSELPLSGQGSDTWFTIDGRPPVAPSDRPNADSRWASAGYFEAMRIPLVKGRYFTEADNEQSPHVVLVSKTLAEKFFPGQDPVGQHMALDFGLPFQCEIVGVVGDVLHRSLAAAPYPMMYVPYAQSAGLRANIVIRARSNALAMVGPVKKQVEAVNPEVPVFSIHAMSGLISDSVGQSSFRTWLLGVFAGTALLLAAAGIYGVMSYSVTLRTHELGIRLALGAGRKELLQAVVGRGMVPVFVGLGAGLAAAFGLARLMAAMLFQVRPGDPASFIAGSALLAAAALLASYLPARRASRVDAVVALRCE